MYTKSQISFSYKNVSLETYFSSGGEKSSSRYEFLFRGDFQYAKVEDLSNTARRISTANEMYVQFRSAFAKKSQSLKNLAFSTMNTVGKDTFPFC